MLAVSIVFICLLIIYFKYILPRYINYVVDPRGKCVLITGCDSGFGNRLALKLNQIGFRVYATVLSLHSTGAHELRSSAVFANKMIVLQMNVTNDEEVKKTLEVVKNDLASNRDILWALVNNAGTITWCPLDWGSLDSYRRLFEVNVFGTVRVTRSFLPLIRSSKGRIINLISMGGRFSSKRIGIYCMTKHSLVAFTDTLRRELYNYGVKVISIEPGAFKTQLASDEVIVKQIENEWNQSSDDVKTFYGSIDSEKNNVFRDSKLIKSEDNIDIVVDDIIDAIINCKPKLIYRPMGLYFRIVSYIMLYSPIGLIDWLLNIV